VQLIPKDKGGRVRVDLHVERINLGGGSCPGQGGTVVSFTLDVLELTSETVATIPADRKRKRIGVGEKVVMTVVPRRVTGTWSVTGQGVLSSTAGSTTTLTAEDRGGAATVSISVGSANCSSDFTVVEPAGIRMRRWAGSGIKHTQHRPDSGLRTEIFLTPADVSFRNVQYREVDIGAVASGVYAPFHGIGHDASPATITVGDVVPGLGSKANGIDSIYSGDPGTPPPFAPGSIRFSIPYEFKVGTGSFKRFTIVEQLSTLAADGVTLTSSKAGASVSIRVGDPTSAF
jgi:hypothetical protein